MILQALAAPTFASYGSMLIGWAFVLLIFGAAVALIGEAIWSAIKALRRKP